jgi:hypothetical protein
MKILPLLLPSLLLCPLLPAAQDAHPAKPEPLAPRADESAGSFDAAGWKVRLRSPDLGERMASFEALLRAGQLDAGARRALEAWAADERDLELCWNARLLLRELENMRALPAPRRPGGLGDVFADPFRGLRPQGSLDALFDELRREVEGLRQGLRVPHGGLRGLPQGLFQSSKGLRLEQTPDGVKVEIEQDVDGRQEKRTYEADSLEELLQAHPELREHISPWPQASRPGRQFPRSFWGDLFGGGAETDDFSTWPPLPAPAPQATPRTDRLGVQVREPLAGARGLEVFEVLPGSLGEALGLRPGDVLLTLQGSALHSVEEVRRILSARQQEEPVVLEVRSADGRTSTLTWRPERSTRPGQRV